LKTRYLLVLLLSVVFVLNSCQESKENMSSQIRSESISSVQIYYESEQLQMVELDEVKLGNLIANTLEIENPVFTELKVEKDEVGNASIMATVESKGREYYFGILLTPYGEEGYQIGKRCFCSGPSCVLTISKERCSCSANEGSDCGKTEIAVTGGNDETLFRK